MSSKINTIGVLFACLKSAIDFLSSSLFSNLRIDKFLKKKLPKLEA
jgi:hypothetical protein